MKPTPQLICLAIAFVAAVACSDMTALKPGIESGGPEKAVAGAKSSYGGAKAKSTASGGAGTSSGGTRSSMGSGGKTSNAGASSGAVGGVLAGGSGGVGSGNAGVGEGGAAEMGGGAAGGPTEPGASSPPFFSEYVEGTGSNKALELAVVEPGRLDGCVVRIYANGALNASRSIALSGPITPEAPVVLCSPQLSALAGVVCDYSETLPFNGNDAVVLSCDGEVVDSIGQLGSDPGEAGWGSDALRTQDRTLRRLCAIRVGDREPSDVFDLAADGWITAATDDFEGLGVRCEPTLDDGAGGAGGAGGSIGVSGAGAGGDVNRDASSLG